MKEWQASSRKIALALFASRVLAGIMPAIASPPGEIIWFDFADPSQLAVWEGREGATIGVTDQWSSRGSQAATITFPRWKPVADIAAAQAQEERTLEDDIEGLAAAARAEARTPSVTVTRESGGLKTLDEFNRQLEQTETTLLERLEFDLYHTHEFPVTVRVALSERNRRAAPGDMFTILPGQQLACSLRLGEDPHNSRLRLADLQATSDIIALSISMMLPDRETTVMVDNIRLRTALPEAATELAAQTARIQQTTAAMPASVSRDFAAQAAGLDRMTKQLLADLRQGSADWNALREKRHRLLLLQREKRRLQPLFNRIRIHHAADNLARGGLVEGQENVVHNLLPASGEPWEFKTDPQNQGLELDWHRADSESGEWQQIPVPARWSTTPVGRYHGYGWYRTVLALPEELEGTTLQLNFSAVDEQAWVYINGELVGEHTVASTGLEPAGLWRRPFSVTVPAEHLRAGQDNVLAIRVHAQAGEAGIWQDVSISLGKVAMVLAVENSMRQVFLEQEKLKAEFPRRHQLQAARNEYESFQAVVVPVGAALENVSWSVRQPRHEASGQELPISVRVVGYVDTDQPRYTVPHTGWWPDPLLDFLSAIEHIPADEVAPLWVTVHVPEGTPAGIYHGSLTVRADNGGPQTLPFSVEVWDFTLPRRRGLPTVFSHNSLTRVIPRTLYGTEKAAAMQDVYEDWLLREYNIDPVFIYGSGTPPWDATRLRELLENGLRLLRIISVNPRRGRPLPEDYWGEYLETRIQRVEDYFQVMNEAGVDEFDDLLQFTYLFDEWSESQDGGLDIVHDTARLLRERWPDRPNIINASCAYDRTYGLERPDQGHIDLWFPSMSIYERAAAHNERARQAGRKIWWYFAIGNFSPTPNWWIESLAIESRLIMGAITAKYRPDGFMYYNINRWWERPTNRWEEEHGGRGLIEESRLDGVRTRWHPNSIGRSPGSLANGDGSLICPGPNGPLATIRLENIRDGMQDYEYYVILRNLLQKQGLPPAEATPSPALVDTIRTYTRDPALVEAERRRLALRILELKKRI